MKAIATFILRVIASAAVLGLVPTVLAHGDDMKIEQGEADKPRPADEYPPTYFAHPEHRTAVYAHVGLMVLGWVFVLPIAVMLSLARSRYTLAAQFLFTAVNTAGVLLAIVYDANTPDLYPNNAHHKLGWVVTWVAAAQLLIGVLSHVAEARGRKRDRDGSDHERVSFIPVSTEAMAEHESQFPLSDRRFSTDSGQGTEPKTESLRSPSPSSGAESPGLALHNVPLRNAGYEEDGHGDIEAVFPRSGAVYSVAQKAVGVVSSRFWKFFTLLYNCIDRAILILGFIALCTGIATFGRFFEGSGIFSGLAHWIKGGVFIWLGIFTLGRWSGSFAELGWAWNLPSAPSRRRLSAEFVESFLIFIYGATNIFLEHLGSPGGPWSSQDLEHVSITVLFLGGGLLGMLIESASVRSLLNTPTSPPTTTAEDEEPEPDSYRTSTNPVPALVILLLGSIMSSHVQESAISTMVHRQWGQLLAGASCARGVTYVVMWLKPPTSRYPGRPPTEVLVAFGLVSGGVIFMASAADTVNGMIHYELDAMFMYTVTMGLVGLLMAWIVVVIAVKGWAVRRERR